MRWIIPLQPVRVCTRIGIVTHKAYWQFCFSITLMFADEAEQLRAEIRKSMTGKTDKDKKQ